MEFLRLTWLFKSVGLFIYLFIYLFDYLNI